MITGPIATAFSVSPNIDMMFLAMGGMITSTIHVLILVPVFFALMKQRALRHGTLQ